MLRLGLSVTSGQGAPAGGRAPWGYLTLRGKRADGSYGVLRGRWPVNMTTNLFGKAV